MNVSAAVGSAASFSCIATGDPAPQILWEDPSGVAIATSTKYTVLSSQLSVHHLEPSDTGAYSCIATSTAGEAVAMGYLDVQCEH